MIIGLVVRERAPQGPPLTVRPNHGPRLSVRAYAGGEIVHAKLKPSGVFIPRPVN
jgi:hypothetical protein